MDIDRLNKILRHYGIEVKAHPMQGNLHEVLDSIDVHAGIDTRGCTCRHHWSAKPVPINSIGTRIWRHERRIEGSHPYHHLGVSAEAA